MQERRKRQFECAVSRRVALGNGCLILLGTPDMCSKCLPLFSPWRAEVVAFYLSVQSTAPCKAWMFSLGYEILEYLSCIYMLPEWLWRDTLRQKSPRGREQEESKWRAVCRSVWIEWHLYFVASSNPWTLYVLF